MNMSCFQNKESKKMCLIGCARSSAFSPGLTAAALDGMMRELSIRRTGALTNAAKVEALMKHMQYSADQISAVLATLKRSALKADHDEQAESVLLAKKHCEAEMLTRLLEEKEVAAWNSRVPAEKAEKAERDKAVVKASSPLDKAAWPVHKAGGSDEMPDIPEGCKLRHYLPTSASPYWRGELPAGEQHLGKMTRCKSYVHSEGCGSAKLESHAARAAVVAWLWEWQEAKAESAASSSGAAGNKRPRSD